MAPPRIITLTTDFGLADAYVGIMKGVILSIAPQVTLVDISHEVQPQNVGQAGYLLQMAYRYFPSDAIHIAVVDPGVGTTRKGLAVSAPHGIFVGPDNGIFWRSLVDQRAIDSETAELVSATAATLTNQAFWRTPVSRTFHGRDIFAPVAAHIAAGAGLTELGEAQKELTPLDERAPLRRGEELIGSIVHIDRFGNAISNIPSSEVPSGITVQVAGRTLRGLATSYQDAGLVAIVGSSGMVEIAARNASAADALGLQVGDAVEIRGAT